MRKYVGLVTVGAALIPIIVFVLIGLRTSTSQPSESSESKSVAARPISWPIIGRRGEDWRTIGRIPELRMVLVRPTPNAEREVLESLHGIEIPSPPAAAHPKAVTAEEVPDLAARWLTDNFGTPEDGIELRFFDLDREPYGGPWGSHERWYFRVRVHATFHGIVVSPSFSAIYVDELDRTQIWGTIIFPRITILDTFCNTSDGGRSALTAAKDHEIGGERHQFARDVVDLIYEWRWSIDVDEALKTFITLHPTWKFETLCCDLSADVKTGTVTSQGPHRR